MNEAAWAGIGAALTAFIGAIVAGYLKIAGERHAKDKELHGTTIEEYRELFDRVQKENDRLNDEISAMRGRKEVLIAKLSACYQNYARAEERIAALEELLAGHNIPFRKWLPRESADSTGEMEASP